MINTIVLMRVSETDLPALPLISIALIFLCRWRYSKSSLGSKLFYHELSFPCIFKKFNNSGHRTVCKLQEQYRWNTVMFHYNSLLQEVGPHFMSTCEGARILVIIIMFNHFFLSVATGNPLLFTTKPPECFMEIRRGFSLTGNTISGPVTVGDPLTLIIYMRSNSDGFDISVNNCYAHNGANKRLNLIDRQGCPSQEKLISAFQGKSTQSTVKQTALSAYFKAFRFTGSPALYIECDVHMCKGSCAQRSRKKRSPFLDQAKEEVEVSEKINLFQSIEVRQEGDEGGVAATVNLSGEPKKHEAKVCIPSFAFAATIAVLVLLISTIISMCLCVRHRHMRSDSKIMKSSTQHPEFMRNPLARLP
ncbi:hypothetical protein GQR58_023459 [Nymphon striatum]|nr:hypothetical protein GQR58_023459 [Nymphon striatum]